jgi:hypothetical protein
MHGSGCEAEWILVERVTGQAIKIRKGRSGKTGIRDPMNLRANANDWTGQTVAAVVLGDPTYRDAHATCATASTRPAAAAAEALERLVHERAAGTHVPGRGVGK